MLITFSDNYVNIFLCPNIYDLKDEIDDQGNNEVSSPVVKDNK